MLNLYSHVKYLGILINKILSWNKQIESIWMKLAGANGTLSKLRYFAPKDIFISVYYSLFYTHLIYGCLDWPYSRKSNIDRLIKLQERYIRIIIFFDFYSHTNPQYSELKLFKVNNICSLTKLLFMFDFIKILTLTDLWSRMKVALSRCFIFKRGKLHDLVWKL